MRRKPNLGNPVRAKCAGSSPHPDPLPQAGEGIAPLYPFAHEIYALTLAMTLTVMFILGFSPIASADSDIGNPTPRLLVTETNGDTFDLSAMRGKVVIVHFWATWCSACKEEMPVLDAFYNRYHKQEVEVVGISLDKPRAKDKVIEYMSAFHFPTALMSEAQKNGFDMPTVLPVTYVIDKQGIVREIFTPDKTPLSQQSLEQVILPLLSFSK